MEFLEGLVLGAGVKKKWWIGKKKVDRILQKLQFRLNQLSHCWIKTISVESNTYQRIMWILPGRRFHILYMYNYSENSQAKILLLYQEVKQTNRQMKGPMWCNWELTQP